MKYKFEDIIYNITEKKKPSEEDRLNYIGLEHLDSGSLFVTRWGAERTPEGEKIVMKKGDVLFGKRRAYQKKVAISPIDGVFSAHGMVLRPKENVICKEFLPFFISSDYFLNEAIRISVGGLSPTINWKDIKVLEFNLPSLAEQKVLAEKLWAAYEVKQSYLKMIEATEEMVKSQFVEMFGNFDSNSKAFAVNSLKNICSINGRIGFRGYTKNDFVYSPKDGAITLSPGNIIDNKMDYSNVSYITWAKYDESPEIKVYDGDILLVKTGSTYGKCAIVKNLPHEATINPQFVVLKNCTISPIYLSYIIQSDYGQRCIKGFVSGSAIPTFTQKDLGEMQIFIPSQKLQNEFELVFKQADKSISELRKSIDAIDKVIKSLINENL